MSWSIPQDAIELIFDHIADDENRDRRRLDTLRSCTLICRALLPHSSRLLFLTPVTLEALTVKEFQESIRTSYRLRAYITSLTVDLREDHTPNDITFVLSIISLLRDTVSNLCALTSLRVIGEWTVDDALQGWDNPPLAEAHPLQHLIVQSAQVPLTNAVLGFFSSIDTLTLSEWSNDRYPDAKVSARAVRQLVVEEPMVPVNALEVPDIVRVLSLPSLTSLSLHLYDMYEEEIMLPAMDALIRAVGQHIAHFEIRHFDESWNPQMELGMQDFLCIVFVFIRM